MTLSISKSTTISLSRIFVIECPKCHRPGRIKIKVVKGHRYVIIDHTDRQCSLGSLNEELKKWIIENVLRRLEEILS